MYFLWDRKFVCKPIGSRVIDEKKFILRLLHKFLIVRLIYHQDFNETGGKNNVSCNSNRMQTKSTVSEKFE